LLFQSTLSLASGSLGQWLLSSRRQQVFMKRLMGVVFAGLAARMILLERDS
jgi:threonine/homoserine/homoserine lactone efflux protein